VPLPPIVSKYFPKCPYQGSVEPVVCGGFLIPKKCAGCHYYFEGECRRAWLNEETLRRLEDPRESVVMPTMDLDFGPCGVPDRDGLARTPPIEEARASLKEPRLWIPEKCVGCQYYSGDVYSSCNRYEKELGLSCGLDFGSMTEERVRELLGTHNGDVSEK
jgi:hypothetical protein